LQTAAYSAGLLSNVSDVVQPWPSSSRLSSSARRSLYGWLPHEVERDQDGLRGEGSLEGWVWRIAFRVAVGSKGSRELAMDEVPEVAFVDESKDSALATAVRHLSPQRRTAVFLRYFADLSYAGIGEALGSPRDGRGDAVSGAQADRR
jgi:hypothetical protein